jgi:uncharacterized membrane protein YgcG
MAKAKLIWSSSEEKKGWQGLNNAAINSFNSNIINSFIREMFQNSNDARDKKLPIDPKTGKKPPLHIVINYKKILKNQFPDFDGFMDVFARIKSAPLNAKHNEFFKNAEKSLGNRQSIKLFVYEDYNTTGLSGADNEDDSTFSGCVLSEGISVGKEKTAGGSYGIGKNSIFGFSKLRTVFYASYNKENEYIFQGRSKLATYFGKDGKKRSDKIFCGNGGELNSVRNFNELLPEHQSVFHRNKPGLSQFAVSPSDHVNWVEEFAKAVLTNYWMLLEKGELIVELKDEDVLQLKIDKENLEGLFKKYFNPETFEVNYSINPYGNPYEYYKCYKTGECTKAKVDIIGDVRFYYSELQNNKTNAVAYLRNDMVVYSQNVHGFSSINYCGVFICDDDDGNSILRDMEPPTHDSFNPERLAEKSEKYDSTDGSHILNGIKRIVRDSLQTISDKYKKAAEDIPWLDELLSSITGAAGNGSGNRTNVQSDKETPERMGEKLKTKINMPSLKRNTVINDEQGIIQGTGGGLGGGTAGGPGGGGGGSGKGGKGGGSSGGGQSKKTRIKSRVFRTNQKKIIGGVEHVGYKLFLSSNQQLGTTDLSISQKGDSGNVAYFEIGEVHDANGNTLSYSKEKNSNDDTVAFKLRSVPIPSEITILLTEPYKSSFKIVKS